MHDTNTNLEKVIETSLTSASFSCVYNIGTGWNLTPMRLNATNVSPSNPGFNLDMQVKQYMISPTQQVLLSWFILPVPWWPSPMCLPGLFPLTRPMPLRLITWPVKTTNNTFFNTSSMFQVAAFSGFLPHVTLDVIFTAGIVPYMTSCKHDKMKALWRDIVRVYLIASNSPQCKFPRCCHVLPQRQLFTIKTIIRVDEQ